MYPLFPVGDAKTATDLTCSTRIRPIQLIVVFPASTRCRTKLKGVGFAAPRIGVRQKTGRAFNSALSASPLVKPVTSATSRLQRTDGPPSAVKRYGRASSPHATPTACGEVLLALNMFSIRSLANWGCRSAVAQAPGRRGPMIGMFPERSIWRKGSRCEQLQHALNSRI
jgi:hypothetical protein